MPIRVVEGVPIKAAPGPADDQYVDLVSLRPGLLDTTDEPRVRSEPSRVRFTTGALQLINDGKTCSWKWG